MELPINLESNHHLSLQAQLFKQVKFLILSGCLTPGSRLPSTRELGTQLGVSRNTITGAYNKLAEAGYVAVQSPRGVFVSDNLPDVTIAVDEDEGTRPLATTRPVHLQSPPRHMQKELYMLPSESTYYDFALERTDRSAFPVKSWRRLFLSKLRSTASNMARYQYPTGLPDLRKAIADYVATHRGITVDPNQVIVVTGIQQGLNLVAQMFVRNGTRVVMETPGYRGASLLFRNYGAELVPAHVDQQGIVLEDLRSVAADLAFVTPSRQYPLCGILSNERRVGLVDWACQAGSYIIEVDYDSDFMYEGSPQRAVQAYDDTGRVIYLTSFSKTLGPGLRLGFMIVPPELVSVTKSTKVLLDYGLPWLEQAVLAEFMGSGAFVNHLKKLRSLYMLRRDVLLKAMAEHFGDARVFGRECGSHIVWRLPETAPAAPALKRTMRKQQVGIHTLRHYSVSGAESMVDRDRYLLMGFSALDEYRIPEGISRIASELEI